MIKANFIFFLIPIILATASAWHLHEDDFFWQYRTGQEIVSHFQIPRFDQWSYTNEGGRFIQIEWLSTVLIYLSTSFLSIVLKTLGIAQNTDQGLFAGAVLLRSALIFTFFFLFQNLMFRICQVASISAALTLLFYVSVQHRLHLRPDFFTWFTLLSVLFNFVPKVGTLKKLTTNTIVYLLFTNVLAFNLHGGTALFTFLFTFVLLITSYECDHLIEKKWLLMILGISPFFTPEHIHLITSIYTHFNYENSKYLTNTEWLSFSIDFLNVKRQGANLATAYILLALSSAMTWYFAFYEPATNKVRIRFWTTQVVILYAFMRIRAIPYALIWVSLELLRNKLIANWLHSLKTSRKPFYIGLMISAILITFFQIDRFKKIVGVDLDISMFPYDTGRYLRDHLVQGNIFAPESVSTYFLYALPEKKVFSDARDVLFNSVKDEYILMLSDYESIKHISEKRGITAIVSQIPNIEVGPDGKVRNELFNKFSKSEWALTFIDLQFIVMLRRVPENLSIISEWEYKLIDPSQPPTMYVSEIAHSPLFQSELEHCLRSAAKSVYCQILKLRQMIEAYVDGMDKADFQSQFEKGSKSVRASELKYNLKPSIYLRIIEKTAASKMKDVAREQSIDHEIQTLTSGPNI